MPTSMDIFSLPFALSNDSCVTSSSNRCCGSIVAASAGEMLKSAVSKFSTPLMKPACFTYILPVVPGEGS
eukprot:2081376-Pyramimonas_sp.AAC.1